jgi:hypothetical protein
MHDFDSCRHANKLGPFHLVDGGPTHLADSLGEEIHTVEVPLPDKTAVRIDRQRPADARWLRSLRIP